MRIVLLGLASAAALWLVAIAALALVGRRTAAGELATLLPNLAILLKGLIVDGRVARSDKALLAFGAAWVASPIDLVPEFVPVLGPLDDVVVVSLILRRVVRHAGPDVLADHWRGSPETLARVLKLFGSR
jgi:uncharacterized membrane protein YkvA (DUF1232 family)